MTREEFWMKCIYSENKGNGDALQKGEGCADQNKTILALPYWCISFSVIFLHFLINTIIHIK